MHLKILKLKNTIKIGNFTSLPNFTTRVNDFWVEYNNEKINQFYSNLSILDNFGNELKNQTISVNNPLRFKNIDIYQSDWNLLGIRLKNQETKKIYEYPVFPLKEKTKSWITWVKTDSSINTLIFDQFQNTFTIYSEEGELLETKNLNEYINEKYAVIDLLPATGLLIKFDPSIKFIYLGFGLLIITTFLSYLPYTQFWVLDYSKNIWIGSSTNRGKIQLEIEFENLIREMENKISKNSFSK